MFSSSKLTESIKGLTQLEFKTEQQRKAKFLAPLTIGLIVIETLALGVSFFPPISPWYSFVTLGVSLALNWVVLFLIRQDYIKTAAHLFCYNYNLLVFVTFLTNLIVEGDIEVGTTVGYILALSVVLAGILIGPRANLSFAVLNTILIAVPYLLVETDKLALIKSFPLITFLWLLALIGWLYQRTMQQAHQRLSMAQYQLMQTQLMQRDLEIARELQQQLYPMPPQIREELTIAARSEPARETSGDFYDFIELNPHELGIIVADVTGKSLAAALIMAMTRSTLRSEARRSNSPARVLYQANQVLNDDASVDQMITTFYGILDTEALTFRFSNAGHIYPLLKRNGQVKDLELNGLPLKATADAFYQEKTYQLYPADQLILVSDGIIEAMNNGHELFGFERLVQTAREIDSTNSHHTLRELWQAVETFRGDVEQQDDMTLVVITIEASQVKQELEPVGSPEAKQAA